MSTSLVEYQLADGVATVMLNDPTQQNALSSVLVVELENIFARLGADEAVRVIILGGHGDYFSSGAPPALLKELAAGHASPSDIRLARALLDAPVPCIAAMAGHAIGGGFALGMAADLVLMARESRYGLTFMNHGFTPGMGSTGLFEHALSPAIAHELLYTGELRRGVDFIASGINHVVARAEVMTKAHDIASRIAEKPRAALSLLKHTLSLPRRQRFEATFTFETLMHEITFKSPEARRRIGELNVE